MSSSRDHEPAERPVQPSVAGPGPHAAAESSGTEVLSWRLQEFDDRSEARHLERLADAKIIEKLRETGGDPDSPEWRLFSAALIEYGLAVLVAWAGAGRLRQRAIERGVRGAARVPAGRIRGERAETLALDVVIAAVTAFREKGIERWRPDGGASLKTYFIGRCLMEIPDVHRAWRSRETEEIPAVLYAVIDDGRFGSFPAEAAEARLLLDEIFEKDPDIRRAFELQQAGYSLEEIATILSTPTSTMTKPALSTRMYRLRGRAHERVAARG